MIGDRFSNVEHILCIGAHGDDVEIGCGGTLLRLIAQRQADDQDVHVHWFIATSNETRGPEIKESANKFLDRSTSFNLSCQDFRDGFLPYMGTQVKESLFELRDALPWKPDLIFTHRLEDRHQDHRLLAELTWNTFRNHCILEYEIPKYEGDLGQPNFFVPLTQSLAARKVELLQECFPSQLDKPWFKPETFWSLLRIRGIESGSGSPFAEAFTARKLVV